MDKQKQALEDLLKLETKLRSLSKADDLADKIFFTTMFKRIREYIEENKSFAPVQVTEQVQPMSVADVDAPQNPETFSLTERASFEEQSNRLSSAYALWLQVKDSVSKAIRSSDKRVISLTTPARPNEEMLNTFDQHTGTALMIVSTNTDAYVMTKDKAGQVTLSSARYWKSVNSVSPN